MNLAPIALFVYARPFHTKRAVESLLSNPEAANSELFVFCDAAKNIDHEESVAQVREIVRSISGFLAVKVVERSHNLGLARSIITGVTEILQKHDKVIVVEDDLYFSPLFLSFMNQGLLRYQDNEAVASIHGYCYPVPVENQQPFFLRGADCWGWATWRRAWKYFNPNGSELLRALNEKKENILFDFGRGSKFTKMLEEQIAGRNDSWAIRWYASTFLANKFTLYPSVSYVANLGHDGSGSHCGENSIYDSKLATALPSFWPIIVEDNKRMRSAFAAFFANESDDLFARIMKRGVRFMTKFRGVKKK